MALRDHAATGEIGVLFAFVFTVVFTLYAGARLLVFRLRHRANPCPPNFWPLRSRRLDRALSLLLALACAAGIACILHGFLVGPTDLEVTRLTLRSAKIRPGTGRLRLVHISDLHSETEPLNEPRAVEIVNALDADIVLATGDYLNDERALPLARETLASLRAAHGVFLVLGNTDLSVLPKDAFAGLPLRVLRKETAELNIRGTPVRIGGMEVGDEPYFRRWRVSPAPGPAFDVFLFHYADLIHEAARSGVDLYLAGHTHGGQIRLPFYGALITLAKTGKKFEAGLYRVGDTTLYVNRGLGMEGGAAPRVRFLCRPEIAVLDLLPLEARGDGRRQSRLP